MKAHKTPEGAAKKEENSHSVEISCCVFVLLKERREKIPNFCSEFSSYSYESKKLVTKGSLIPVSMP